MITSATPSRAPDFYSARHTPQYATAHSYSQRPSPSFVHDQANGQYPAAHYLRQGLVQGQSATANYASPPKVGDWHSVRDQSSTAGREGLARLSGESSMIS